MAKVQSLSDTAYLHLLKLAGGLLSSTDGDIVGAMRQAMLLHMELLRSVRQRELKADLGPGNAILFVPEEGGLALRLERHPSDSKSSVQEPPGDLGPIITFTEEEITGFEVTENFSSYVSEAQYDGGVLEDWD